jgi:hypothetical protein
MYLYVNMIMFVFVLDLSSTYERKHALCPHYFTSEYRFATWIYLVINPFYIIAHEIGTINMISC